MSATALTILKAAGWMGLTIASFILMAVSGRELASAMSTFEILAWRSLIGFLILVPIVLRAGLPHIATRRAGFHLARNTVHFMGQAAWFYGLGVLTLAEVTALEFTMPLWGAVLAALFLKERVDGLQWGAIVTGFAGVLIILQPGTGAISSAALIVLGGAACYGSSAVMVKALTRTDTPLSVVFYMQAIQFPLGLVLALTLFDWVWPPWAEVPWLIAVGVTGMTAHYGMARAFAIADISLVYPIDFLRLPLTALVGFAAYGEIVAVPLAVGSAVLVASVYYNVLRGTRRKNREAAAQAGE